MKKNIISTLFFLTCFLKLNMLSMQQDSKIYVAGHRGLVGSAILNELMKQGYSEKNIITRTSEELDLRNQNDVENFFATEKPEFVFLAAAKVGGIKANMTYPADFIADNLSIQNNVINSACKHDVKKLLFPGSSCIYPRRLGPIEEKCLLDGPLEPTNEAYAVAKIAGIKLCQSIYKQHKKKFISCMPTNLFGPGDKFDLETAHALPALITKMHKAKINHEKEVIVWGTGNARREWLYVDDLAKACIFLMQHYNDNEIINIGTGIDLSMKELAEKIKKIVEFEGDLVFDSTKPEGTPQKLLDISKISKIGWKPEISLEDGIKKTYQYYLTEVFQH